MSDVSTVSTTDMKSDLSTPEESSSPNCPDSTTTATSVAATPGGTQIPNRVFVGGIALTMTESELFEVFANFGRVRTARIIHDKSGRPKGYGFVTYVTEAEAKWVHDNMPYVYFGQRRLNVAPAFKKQVPNAEILEDGVDFLEKSPARPVSSTRRRKHMGTSGTVRRGVGLSDTVVTEVDDSGVAWTSPSICFWPPHQPAAVSRPAMTVDAVNLPQIHCTDYNIPATWSACRPHEFPMTAHPSITPQLCCPFPLPMPYLVVPQTVYPASTNRLLPSIYVQHPNTAFCAPRQDKSTESAMWKLVSVPGSC